MNFNTLSAMADDALLSKAQVIELLALQPVSERAYIHGLRQWALEQACSHAGSSYPMTQMITDADLIEQYVLNGAPQP